MTGNRPVFYYAQGTTYVWRAFGKQGLQAGMDGSGLYVLGQPLTAPDVTQATHVKGLDGETFYWDGFLDNDPFPLLLDEDLWEYKRVPYPATALFVGPSIEFGVDWIIEDILSKPVGTPFACGGYSQGGAVMGRLYQECRVGRLKDRRADLRAVITFGSPMREQGHTWVGSSGFSGAVDIPGDTRSGAGIFPSYSDIDWASPFISRFVRLQNTEDLVWDFVMPFEVVTSFGFTQDAAAVRQLTRDGLRLLPIYVVASFQQGTNVVASYNGLPAGVPKGVDPARPELGVNYMVTDPVTGNVTYWPGGGHIMYPFSPPPNADGSIPSSGDTCYQIAAKYLRRVGEQIFNELHPSVPEPVSRAAFSWFSALPGE